MKVKNIDIRQALNILSIANKRQLREIEKLIKSERDSCPKDDADYLNKQIEHIDAIRKIYG